MTFADAKQRFSNRVADYTRYRPSYPPALLDLLVKECGLRADHVIADIGSGTGLLSKLFLEHGNHVYGVEPNGEMRAGGEDFLRGYAKFTSCQRFRRRNYARPCFGGLRHRRTSVSLV